jgi:predicted ATPase
MARRGRLIVFLGSIGVGKSTTVKEILVRGFALPLISNIKDKIIITSINSKLLGDCRFYLHKNFNFLSRLLVLWYEVVI